MIYKYPDYENNPFKFLETVTQDNINKFISYDINPVVERFKIIDNSIAENIKENMYAISTFGRVFNIRTGHELSLTQNDDYYLSLGLQQNDNSRKNYLAHRLVANAFIEKTEDDIKNGRDCINHKNLMPSYNYYKNLEYATRAENNAHAKANNADKINKCIQKSKSNWSNGAITAGEHNGMCRVTDNQVHIICQSLQNGCTRKEACINAGLKGDKHDLAVVKTIVNGTKRKNISCLYDLSNSI